MKKLVTLALLFLNAFAALAACPSWPTAQRFVLNGAEATDTRTGLVWARCSVGQTWSGTACTGSAGTFTHEAALQWASAQTGWRLPNRRELSSLADKGCSAPAIDSVVFPNTTSWHYWTSSPRVGFSQDVWLVNFQTGVVSPGNRANPVSLRLVRVSP